MTAADEWEEPVREGEGDAAGVPEGSPVAEGDIEASVAGLLDALRRLRPPPAAKSDRGG